MMLFFPSPFEVVEHVIVEVSELMEGCSLVAALGLPRKVRRVAALRHISISAVSRSRTLGMSLSPGALQRGL